MSNEVTSKTGGALAAAQALKKNLQTVQSQMPAASNAHYLRMLTDGAWVFGAENTEMPSKDELAVNPLSVQMGWSCWSNHSDPAVKNELLGEHMFPLGQPVTPKHELPDHGFPWKEQISVQLRVMEGKHKGKQLAYSTNSAGGIKAMRGIIDQILLQLDEDPEYIVPVVTVSSSHYDHKKWGRTYVPEINIVAFTDMDATAPEEGDKPEPEAKPEPEEQKPRTRTRSTKEADDRPKTEVRDDVDDAEVVEEAKPVRRRRRA